MHSLVENNWLHCWNNQGTMILRSTNVVPTIALLISELQVSFNVYDFDQCEYIKRTVWK